MNRSMFDSRRAEIRASFPPGYRRPRRSPLSTTGWLVVCLVAGAVVGLFLRLIGR